ncbi:MarR family winged helix-turn-helix transcriptional regulator [Methylocapsa acidiphila]|uniref:MarR family winged helix-turn-helix transcriptional regulator n=1 Tax=Methylocapsa acidiphila TaxID=133552 RepID=UPI0012EC870A|nr:MarR family transcriptional regulator [Methylocapsa acidiphila]
MADDDAMPRLDQQLCFTIYSTMHALGKAYAPLLDGIGLTYPQYLVMLVLWEADDLTVKDIGERLHLDSGTLTPLLKRLEALGVLHRARDAKDERQVRIGLTEKGHALRREAKAIPSQIARAMGRPAEDLKSLRKDLRRLRNALLGKRAKSDAKASGD